jgi:O-antigen ligase
MVKMINSLQVNNINKRDKLDMAFIMLSVFTIVLFSRPHEIYPQIGAIPLQKLFAIAALLSSLFLINRKVLDRFNDKIMKYMLLYILAILLSIPFGLWVGGSAQFVMDTIIKQLIILFVIIVTVNNYNRIRKLLLIIGISTFIVGLLTIVRYVSGRDLIGGYRASVSDGVFGDPNDLALHFVFSIPLLYFVGYRTAKRKLIFILMILTLVFAVLITYSRGGILGLGFSALAIWYFDNEKRKKNLMLIIMGIILCITMFPDVIERMATMIEPEKDTVGSAQARMRVLNIGIQIFLENPVFGVGVNNFPIAEGMTHQTGLWAAPHNSFIQIASETGILGLIAFIACFILLFNFSPTIESDINNYHDFKMMIMGIKTSALGFLVCATFLSQAYSWYFFYLVAFSVLAKEFYKKSLSVKLK